MFGALLVVSIATVMIFGVVPALKGSKTDVNEALKDGGSGRTVAATRRWSTGGRASCRLVTACASRTAFHRRIADEFEKLPQVASVSIASTVPLRGAPEQRLELAARMPVPGSTPPAVRVVSVVYLPLETNPPATVSMLVRSRGDSGTAAALRTATAAADPQLPLQRIMTMADVAHEAEWNGRLAARFLTTLTLIGVSLVIAGLYAVTAHASGAAKARARHPHGARRAGGT